MLGLFLGTFAATFVVFLPGQFIQMLNVPLGLFVTSLGLFGGAGLAFPAAFNLRVSAFTGWGRSPARWLVLGALLGLANLAFANFLMGALRELLPTAWSRMADDTTRLLLRADVPTRWILTAAASLAAPLGEELFFRGWLQPTLSTRWRPAFAIGATAVVFSATHLDVVGFLPRVELGLLFGLLRHRTGRLGPAMAAHAAHNFASAGGLYLTDDPLAELDAPFEWTTTGLAALASVAATGWLLARLQRLPAPPPINVEPADPAAPALVWHRRAAVRAFALAVLVLSGTTLALYAARDRLPGRDMLRTAAASAPR